MDSLVVSPSLPLAIRTCFRGYSWPIRSNEPGHESPTPGSVPDFRSRYLSPVIERQRHSPDISRLLQFYTAVQRILRSDEHNPSRRSLIGQVDMNRDFRASAQPNCGCDQYSMQVNDDGHTLARKTPRALFDCDYHFERDASTSSGITKLRGGHGWKDTCSGQPLKA